MDDSRRRHPILWAVIVAMSQGVVWTALFAFLAIFGPPYERLFHDFRLELPAVTRSFVSLTHFVYDYWYLVVVLVLLWMLVNGGVVWLLDRSQSVIGKIGWYVVTWLAALAFLVFANLALVIPMANLVKTLQH